MRVHAETERWTLYQGDVLEVLRALPDESVQCVVTSPPYYGLRDYGLPPSVWGGDPECIHQWGDSLRHSGYQRGNRPGDYSTSSLTNPERQDEVPRAAHAGQFCDRCGAWRGTLGLEPTPELYVEHLVTVFREVRRVLRADGTLWLNLGDSYNGSGGAGGDYGDGGLREGQLRYEGRRLRGLKPKDLIGVPWRAAFALQADGWWLRSDIVWAKRAPMPESVTDRPTRAHEFIFLLAKSQRYYYDVEALREPGQEWPGQAGTFARASGKQPGLKVPGQDHVSHRANRTDRVPTGRNARDVWLLGPDPYPEAHFATFPREIPRRAILAGSSPQVCPTCGAPWRRVVVRTPMQAQNASRYAQGLGDVSIARTRAKMHFTGGASETTAWEPTCSCPDNNGSGTSVVLDPFAGSGTTLEAAVSLGRHAVGIELSKSYCDLAVKRMERVTPALPGLAI